jgi:hypothetical protein
MLDLSTLGLEVHRWSQSLFAVETQHRKTDVPKR